MTIAQDSSHPTGVRDDSPKGSGGAIVARDRKSKAAIALRMRKEYEDWDTIAQVLGYPTARAAQVAVETTLRKEYQEESAEFSRRIAGQRLDEMLASVYPKATNPKDPDHLLYLREARILIGQHMDMFGYAAPKRAAIATPTAAVLEQWVSNVTRVTSPEVEEADIFDIEVVEDTEGGSDALPA